MSETEMTQEEYDRLMRELGYTVNSETDTERREREAREHTERMARMREFERQRQQEDMFRSIYDTETLERERRIDPHHYTFSYPTAQRTELKGEALVKHVAQQYFHLKNGLIQPSGHYRENRMWFPSSEEKQPCCVNITEPSARFPYTLLNHCRTVKHLAQKYNIEETELRQAIRQHRRDIINNRNWFDPVECPECHLHVEPRAENYTPLPQTNGLSRDTKEVLLMPFIQNSVNREMRDRQRFRVIRMFRCRYCHIEILTACTNEVYRWYRGKSKWIKMRGFHKTEPKPTELIVSCPICGNNLRELKQYIKNTNGINRSTQDVQKSKRMICDTCKSHLDNNGFVYRVFEDFSMLRFCFSLNMWVPISFSYNNRNRNRRDNDRPIQSRLTYSKYQTPIERMLMHIRVKSENNINENGLFKELEPFKEILTDIEETQIVEMLDSIRPKLVT